MKKTGKKILVVDDEAVVCNALNEFLTKRGYSVTVVLSGKEAIEKIKEAFHIVLLDIRMPGMDGIETLSKIKEMDKKVGIIMITAVNDDEVARKCIELGADDYITKPFDLNYLKRVLSKKLLDFGV